MAANYFDTSANSICSTEDTRAALMIRVHLHELFIEDRARTATSRRRLNYAVPSHGIKSNLNERTGSGIERPQPRTKPGSHGMLLMCSTDGHLRMHALMERRRRACKPVSSAL